MPYATTSTWTLNDVMRYVRRQFGDEDSVQITDNDLIGWANQGQQAINAKDPMITGYGTTVTGGNEVSFNLPSNLMKLEFITYDGLPLRPVEPVEGIAQAALLGSGGSAPQLFYVWGDTFFLVPNPDEAGHNLVVYYIARPSNLANLSDFISIPDQYFEELCQFVMAKAYELDQDWQAQQVVSAAFESGMTEKSLSNRNVIGANLAIRDVDSEDEYYYEVY